MHFRPLMARAASRNESVKRPSTLFPALRLPNERVCPVTVLRRVKLFFLGLRSEIVERCFSVGLAIGESCFFGLHGIAFGLYFSVLNLGR